MNRTQNFILFQNFSPQNPYKKSSQNLQNNLYVFTLGTIAETIIPHNI